MVILQEFLAAVFAATGSDDQSILEGLARCRTFLGYGAID
jgi:hypothetical protein